VSLNKF